jgi:hypothetical protein
MAKRRRRPMPDDEQIMEEAGRIREDGRAQVIFDDIFAGITEWDPKHEAIYGEAVGRIVGMGFSKEAAEEWVNEQFEEYRG